MCIDSSPFHQIYNFKTAVKKYFKFSAFINNNTNNYYKNQ